MQGLNRTSSTFRQGMRILFLALDVDMVRQRGESVHTAELAQALHRLGHDVLCLVGTLPNNSESDREGPLFRSARGPDPRLLPAVLRICDAFRPDVVYERRTTPKIGVAIQILKSMPVVMEINGILEDELSFQGRAPSRSPIASIKGALRGLLFRRVDAFVAVSNAIATHLESRYRIPKERIRVIGNGVNPDRFAPRGQQEAAVRAGLDPSRPRILFLGNLVGWRDLDTVLDAVSRILPVVPRLEFVIAGDGQDRPRLMAVARDLPEGAVLFKGEVPYGTVPDLIAASDVCLLPERPRALDISPLKLFEYLACAKPVVAFDVPGLSFIDREGMGVLVPAGDPEALGQAVLSLLANSSLREEMGRHGRRYVEKNRTWGSVAEAVAAVLQGGAGVGA